MGLIRKIVKKAVVLLYKIMCHLPVKKNLIVFDSNVSKSYSGNPQYIYEYLVKMGADKEYDIVFFYEKKPFDIPGSARQIRFRSLAYLYNMAVAKFWIFDSRQPAFLKKRKGVTYLQTWHGTPLKRLALDMKELHMKGEGDIDSYKKTFTENVKTWDYLIAPNEYSDKIFRRAFAFEGKMLDIGYPRNDILSNCDKDMQLDIRKELRLPLDKKIILYAPTWRDDEATQNQQYEFKPQISFDKLRDSLGDEYVMIVKYHYLIMDKIDWSPYEGFIYNFDQSTDIAKLYIASDILITDYSSVMFDFSILKRPQFFYAYDLEKYKDELRGFYFEYSQDNLPGPISTYTEELISQIKNYSYDEWEGKLSEFKKSFNDWENGRSCEAVLKLIREKMNN